jgi:4-amino-4-deoxychorismate lyase
MATNGEIVVTLDGEIVPAAHPVAYVDDPMFARGDGVFETLLVRGGRARLLDAHLERLTRSAAIIGMPPPDPVRWRAATATAEAAWTAAEDAVLRMVVGRGRDGGPVGFVTVSGLPDRVLVSRRDGLSAMTVDRGPAAGEGASAPWSITGAKSLSYAANAAALRHAERLGIGDVVLISSDGFVLEGPRSSVVIASEDGVLTTPPTTLPILPGTTVRAVLEVACRRGMACAEQPLRVRDLLVAKGVWLLSSVTLAARVHTLDGVVLPAVAETFDMTTIVDEAIDGTS